MSKKDPYASEAETQALLVPDTRTAAESKLAQMMTARGADEQGAEALPILWKIAVDLLAEQPAQQEPVAITTGMALAFHRAMSDGPISDAEAKEIKHGLEAAFAHITSPQPAQRKPLDLSSAIQYADARWSGVDVPIEWCRHFADALAEQPAPVQQEPVAWMDPEGDENCNIITDAWKKHLRAHTTRLEKEHAAEHTVPVYTSPQPAQRKPLTKQERSIIHATTASMRFFEAVEYAISKTEADHGIKENT